VALYVGLRRNEIRLLRWRQVDLVNPKITVAESKTDAGAGREVPLLGLALKVMHEWEKNFPDHKPEHYVFPHERYSPGSSKKAPRGYDLDPTRPLNNWKTSWTTARKRAGIWVRYHDLRHTAGTRFMQKMPLPMVAKVMGWTPSTMYEMSMRYGHFTVEEMRAAMNQAPSGPRPPVAKQKNIKKTTKRQNLKKTKGRPNREGMHLRYVCVHGAKSTGHLSLSKGGTLKRRQLISKSNHQSSTKSIREANLACFFGARCQ